MLCPRPSIPPNSYVIYPGIKGSYVHGIKLFLGCRDGYYLTGSPIMDCNQTVWSKVEFRCIGAYLWLSLLVNQSESESKFVLKTTKNSDIWFESLERHLM